MTGYEQFRRAAASLGAWVADPADEVVGLVSALIRFDTSNTGELETTKGEAECAQWVEGRGTRSFLVSPPGYG